jgi:RNA polymerase sigma-70 factor, ECF subfamily
MKAEEFAKIVSETKKIVLSAIEKNLAERFSDSIDDVVQETYLRAYKALSKDAFRGDSAISTWLYTIARNESLRMNEKLSREERKIEKLKSNPIQEQESEDESSLDRLFGWLKQIPEKYRVVLESYLKGKPETEIAKELNIEKGTVKSRAHRGREMLKRIMTGEKNE